MITTEKRFEADIESFFLSPAGGYTKGADTYDANGVVHFKCSRKFPKNLLN